MEFVRATESAAIRVEVGIIDRFLPFNEQLEIVESALVAAEQLVDVAIVIQDSLDCVQKPHTIRPLTMQS